MTDLERAKWLMKYLRRISRWWPEANKALNKAKRGPNQFECASCGYMFARKEVHRDHIEPVVPTTGLKSTLQLIERMFCSEDGYQILCKPCHDDKSQDENADRRAARKRRKRRKTPCRRKQ